MTHAKLPSQVWVGNAQVLKEQVITYLQKQFCVVSRERACLNCASCCQIKHTQYHNILWLVPDGQYKVDQVREVLLRLSLRLAQDEQFYFIFQDAHCLNESSANSLLKSIEEPPIGYNFVFLVPRKELLLNTILSRSHIQQFDSNDGIVEHEIFDCFTVKNFNPVEFSTMLEKYKDLSDQDSRTLLDQIYGYWLHRAQKDLSVDEQQKNQRVIAILQHAQESLPMPGSSKLFWRDLYLQWI